MLQTDSSIGDCLIRLQANNLAIHSYKSWGKRGNQVLTVCAQTIQTLSMSTSSFALVSKFSF